MTRIDVTPIEEMHRHLVQENIALGKLADINGAKYDEALREIATLREVNAAQAEQLRKAQERIRAAEAERDRAWNEAIEAAALIAFPEGTRTRENPGFWNGRITLARNIRSLAKDAGE